MYSFRKEHEVKIPESASTVLTSIPVQDLPIFEKFLQQKGYKEFEAFESNKQPGNVCLLFLDRTEALKYRILGAETAYLRARQTPSTDAQTPFNFSALGLDWDDEEGETK